MTPCVPQRVSPPCASRVAAESVVQTARRRSGRTGGWRPPLAFHAGSLASSKAANRCGGHETTSPQAVKQTCRVYSSSRAGTDWGAKMVAGVMLAARRDSRLQWTPTGRFATCGRRGGAHSRLAIAWRSKAIQTRGQTIPSWRGHCREADAAAPAAGSSVPASGRQVGANQPPHALPAGPLPPARGRATFLAAPQRTPAPALKPRDGGVSLTGREWDHGVWWGTVPTGGSSAPPAVPFLVVFVQTRHRRHKRRSPRQQTPTEQRPRCLNYACIISFEAARPPSVGVADCANRYAVTA